MNKQILLSAIALALTPVMFTMPAQTVNAAVEINAPAPDFTAIDIYGNPFKLSEQKGKTVILEWTNHECPFVKKQYDSGNMQQTQKTATDKGAIWVSVVSSAPGKQGNVTPEQAQEIVKTTGAQATTRILDETGEIGKLFDAKTTPDMVVIDPEGKLVYEGAIDDASDLSADPATAKNYVLAALDNLSAGQPVETPKTEPYGCAVKY